jgi:hypothetical protein
MSTNHAFAAICSTVLAIGGCHSQPAAIDAAPGDDAPPSIDAEVAVDAASDAAAATCSFPQNVPDPDFTPCATSYGDTDPVVDNAVNAAMAELTGCPIGSSCDLTFLPGANADEKCQSWFAAVTAKLRAEGDCAGQHIVGNTDEIAVSNTGCPGKWYGYHICYYGGPKVVWNPGARRGWCQITPSYCP